MDKFLLAKKILGNYFIDPTEIKIGITYSEAMVAQLEKTMPSLEVFKWCKENHYMVVPGPPEELNIIDIMDLFGDKFFFQEGEFKLRDYVDKGIHKGHATRDKVSGGWLIVNKNPAFHGKKWEEQQKMLEPGEAAISAPEFCWISLIVKTMGMMSPFNYTGYFRTSSKKDVILILPGRVYEEEKLEVCFKDGLIYIRPWATTDPWQQPPPIIKKLQ